MRTLGAYRPRGVLGSPPRVLASPPGENPHRVREARQPGPTPSRTPARAATITYRRRPPAWSVDTTCPETCSTSTSAPPDRRHYLPAGRCAPQLLSVRPRWSCHPSLWRCEPDRRGPNTAVCVRGIPRIDVDDRHALVVGPFRRPRPRPQVDNVTRSSRPMISSGITCQLPLARRCEPAPSGRCPFATEDAPARVPRRDTRSASCNRRLRRATSPDLGHALRRTRGR